MSDIEEPVHDTEGTLQEESKQYENDQDEAEADEEASPVPSIEELHDQKPEDDEQLVENNEDDEQLVANENEDDVNTNFSYDINDDPLDACPPDFEKADIHRDASRVK